MIKKSYSKLTQDEKKLVIEYYYNNKNESKIDICNKFEISGRCYLNIMKEFDINSKLKNRYTLNDNYFSNIDSEAKAYILGFLCADGYVGDNNELVVTCKDKSILNLIKNQLNYTGDIKEVNSSGYNKNAQHYRITISSLQINLDLRKLGLYPNKSLTFDKIPNIDRKLIRHFLRGYFDGDGSITYAKNTKKHKDIVYEYNILVFNLIAAEDFIKEFIKETELEKYSIRNSKTEEMKYLVIKAKAELNKIYELFYKDASIYLDRKYEIWQKKIT